MGPQPTHQTWPLLPRLWNGDLPKDKGMEGTTPDLSLPILCLWRCSPHSGRQFGVAGLRPTPGRGVFAGGILGTHVSFVDFLCGPRIHFILFYFIFLSFLFFNFILFLNLTKLY